MAITYKDAGAGGGTETDSAQLALDCPATVDANDILIAHVNWLDNTSEPSDPSGWTRLYPTSGLGAAMGTGTPVGRSYVYGKIAVGDEDGDTINFGTVGGTAGRFGRIYSFAGYSSGTISQVVRGFSDIPKEDDPALPTVTTSKAGALAIALIAQDDNNAQAAGGAQTGGTWAEPVAEFSSATLGAQGCACGVQTCTPTADPGTVTGGVLTTNTDESSTIGFEIRDAPVQTAVAEISLAAGNTPDVDTGHSIKVRARTTAGAGTIRAALYEGSNNRSGDLESSALTTSLDDYTLAISEANAATITSYSDLSIKFWGYADAGGAIVFEVDQLYLQIPEGTVAYSLNCEPGSFTVTGAAATLAAGQLFEASPGSYAVTGAAATIAAGYTLSCDPGAYAINGSDATMLAGAQVSADPGAYTVTGSDATLAAGQLFAADPGSYAVTGADAALSAGAAVSADPGSYAITGVDAALTAGAALSADPGSYASTGAAATLAAGQLFNAEPGAYAVTGADATLEETGVVSADPGSYTITGADAELVYTQVGAFDIDAEPGSYAVTGSSAVTEAGRTADAQPGTYAITGVAAELVYTQAAAYNINAEPGSYAVTGANATTVTTRELSADPGAYSVTGQDAGLTAGTVLALDPGVYTITGSAATLTADSVLSADPGVYVITGVAATLTSSAVPTGPATVIGGDTSRNHSTAGNTGRTRTLGGDRATAYASSGDRRSDP